MCALLVRRSSYPSDNFIGVQEAYPQQSVDFKADYTARIVP
jgi:hypothetical protein